MTTLEGYIAENKAETDLIVRVKGKRKEYPIAVSVDWKADPADVIEQVNRYLKDHKIEFTHVDTGDDSFTFIADYKK